MVVSGNPESEFSSLLDRVLLDTLPKKLLLELAGTDRPLDPELRARIVSIGLLEIGIPEESGGLGLQTIELVEIFRVAGRRLLPISIRDEALVVAPMVAEASRQGDEGCAELLSLLLSGRVSGGCRVLSDYATSAVNILHEARAAELLDLQIWASPSPSVISIVALEWATLIDPSTTKALLEPSFGIEPAQGLARLSANVRLGRSIDFDPAWTRRCFRAWHIGMFAELLGCAEEVLDKSVSYAKVREQFGQPISSFQAVAHMLSEMKARVELASSALARLVALFDDDNEGLDDLIDTMRYFIPVMAREVCEAGIQVHGGMGFTWEYGLHLYYRRALQMQAALGGHVRCAVGLGVRLLSEGGELARVPP
jgi:alkylation response protein AidB-like acyl-CoA dehydrogenase